MSAALAVNVRDSLAKSLYKYIFQHIFCTFNGNAIKSLPYMGIFDIAGFGELDFFLNYNLFYKIYMDLFFIHIEYFEKRGNCFEQLCINYVNERFQKLFVEKMLKTEREWYEKEAIDIPDITFFDNAHIVGKNKV